MAIFTYDEYKKITANRREKNKNSPKQYAKQDENGNWTAATASDLFDQRDTISVAPLRKKETATKAQTTTQSAPNRRISGLPTEGEPVDIKEIYQQNLIRGQTRPTENINITEKLKKDLGSDYDLFASQGIQGGNNPEYIGAFGENFKTGLKSFGRNILNTVDAIKSNNTNDARLIQAIERARQEAPNNAEVEKGLQIAIKNQNPYEKQAAVEKQAAEKVLQRRQKTRQENARNNETYGNLPGYGIVRGAGQLAGAYTPTIVLNAVAPGLGSATYYTNAYGSAFAQSVGEGATYRQAKQYARLDTALEYARMHAYNTIRGLTPEGSLLGENGWRKVADKFVKTNTGRYLFKKTLDVTRAGRMAILDKVITPYLKRAVYDPDADLANMADVLNAFGGAALVTAVLGALNFKQEYNDINNGYRYTDTFTKDREDINKWFKGVDNLEDAKRIHNAYVKSYADVRNSADVDPARLAELQEIENAFTSLKAQLKNKSARRSMATNEPRTATETAAEPNAPQMTEVSPIMATKPQAGETQAFPLPQGETPKYDEVTGERLYTSQDIRQMFGDMLQEQKDTADPTQKALTDFKSRYINGDFDSEVPAEIQATEKALQESGVKFSTADLDNAISGRQATKRYETVATKQPITPKTKRRDKLNEIIRDNGDNKEEQLKRLKESVKSEPAKKAIQAEIDKLLTASKPSEVVRGNAPVTVNEADIEKSLKIAKFEDNFAKKREARYFLTKQGINWRTGKEMPIKLTAPQVDKLSHMVDANQRGYYVFSNNGNIYYQNEVLYELGKDGEEKKALTYKETEKIFHNPNTVKIAKFDPLQGILIYKTQAERMAKQTAPEKVTGAKVVDTIDGVNVYDKVPDGWVTGSTRAPKGYISVSNNFATYGVPNKQVGYVKKADATASESQEKRVENSEVNVSEREKETEKLQSLESEESIQTDIERIDAENKNLENELENSTDEPDTDESITVPTTTRARRYEIDEKTAKLARNMRSQRGYKAGEATSEYNEYLTKAEEIAKAAKEKNPAESERIDYLLNKYSQKIARNINAVAANESKYPAWFVSGPARYNVKKNEALMRRTMDLFNQRESYDKILDKIQRIGNGTEAIKSSDANAVEKLTDKLEKLKRYHSQAKIANAYYKKNGSLEGFHPVGLTWEQEKQMFEGARWMKEHYPTVTAPFNLTNSNAEIHRLEDRIKNIQSAKEAGNKEVVANSNYRVVKNAEKMQLQYFFDGKPDPKVLQIMKSNGFRWSHKNMAWQRQLTANAEYAGRRVNEALNKFYGESKPTEQATEDKKKVTLYSTIPNQEGFNELCDNFGKQVMDEIKERLARDENLPEEENAVFNTADLDNLSEEEAQQLRTTQEGAKKFKSLKANNIAPNEWEQKVQKEYSDIFKEAFENKETVREIKKKRDKKGLPMTPEVFKIIRKIPSFYGYNGPVPANVVEGEDPILFNIQKPITPKGRMVKLNSKANQRYKGYIEKYGEIKTAPIKGAVPLKDVDTAQISNMSTEEKIELARSHGDRAQITAARKALVKEGINWRTGEEMPIKLTPKQVNRLFSRIGKNKDIEYTVYKNGGKMYYSNGKSMFSMDEDGETNGVMPLNQIKAFTENPDTAKVVSFNYKDVVVPYNRDGTVSMPDNSEIVEERKRREVKVPKKVDDENPNSFVSESAKTIMQSPAMTDEGAQTLKKAVLDGVFNYEKVANKEALEEANKTIEEKGYEEAYKQWQRVVEGKEQLDVKKIALGVELLNNAVNNNDASRMVEIASGLQMFSTLGAQITQFGNVWRDLTPNGRLYTAQTAVKYINQQQLEKINKGLAKEVTIPASLQEKLLNAGGNLKERERIMEEIQQSIADQLPGTWDEKLRGIRYLAMLGNPRTHIRNFFGNLAMVLPDIAKNLVGSGLEKRIPKDQRTKAPIKATVKLLFGEDRKNIKDFVEEEYERYRPMIKGEAKYKGDFKSGIQGKRDIFSSRKEIKENGRVVGYETKKSKIWGPLSRTNSARLEWEDEKFLKPYFKNRYRSAMAARGLTITDLKNNDELRLEIVNIAAKEAQTNTYRDFNIRANWINELKRKPLRRAKESKTLPGKALNYAGNFLGEGLLPFTQTPMNILKKGVEYSPVGLVKGLEERLVEVKKGNITAAQAIDNVAKGLTGTGLVVLGFYLASIGKLKGQGNSDKKQRAIDDLKGEQKNSLQIGDVSYTIDWSAPAIMPVLVGANIYQMAKERDNLDFGTVISGLITIPDTITDLSLLQGVNTAIKAARYSDNPVGTVGVHLLTNYGTQFIPTISGQVARTLDPVRRNAYFKDKSGSSIIPEALQPTVNKVVAKIPGASMRLTPYIDAWGNVEQKDSRLAAGLENFFSPGYVSKITRDDPATNEVERLYHQTGIGTVVPKNPEKSITFYGNEQKLSGEQWTDYAINKGKMSYEMVMSAIKAPEYNDLSDEVKAKVITDIYDYCGNQAKQKLADEYDDINFFLEDKDLQREQLMELGISPATVFSASKVANTDGNTAVSGAEAFNYLESREDIDLVQRMYMYHYLVPRAKNNPYGNISDYEDE